MFRIVVFLAVLLYSLLLAGYKVHGQKAGERLPAWEKGMLDIHHINTGAGNAAYFIFPDGTTLLVDAGELSPLDPRSNTPRNAPMRPSGRKRPYEWIVDYIRAVGPPRHKDTLDYALITHFHDDHFGAWHPDAPLSADQTYRLTGITGVGSQLSIRRLIDRGYPGYDFPFDLRKDAGRHPRGELEFGRTMSNYFDFLAAQQKKGMKMDSLRTGSDSQIRPLYDSSYASTFRVRGVKSGRWIWTGVDSTAYDHFPASVSSRPETWPDENSLSLVLLLQYGHFRYYTGGDCGGNLLEGEPSARDVETPVSKVVGPVDVAVMDHHGNRDAVNAAQVKALRPRIWVGQTWSSDHPGHEVLLRMLSTHLYAGPRDLFATNMLESNRLVIGTLIDRSYKSQQGHTVIRVEPGGERYWVLILDDTREGAYIRSVFGPYLSRVL